MLALHGVLPVAARAVAGTDKHTKHEANLTHDCVQHNQTNIGIIAKDRRIYFV